MMSRRDAALVVLACVALRVPLLVLPPPEPNYYWDLSTSLLASGTYAYGHLSTTSIEPLYPLFLAAARALTGDRYPLVMLVQILAAAAGGVLLFSLTIRLTASRRAAVTAAALYALHPYYVRQSVAPHELTLSTVLLLGAAWQFPRVRDTSSAAALGIWMALLMLLRFTFIPLWIGTAILLIAWRRPAHAAVVLLIPIAAIAPWILRSRTIDGGLLPSRVGENLFVSTCELSDQVVPYYDVDLMLRDAYRQVEAAGVTEGLPPPAVKRAADDWLLRRAIDCARARPLRTAWFKLRNAAFVFSPQLLPAHARLPETQAIVADGRVTFTGLQPRPRWESAAHFAVQSLILTTAVAGLLLRRRWREDAFLLMILASFAIVYGVFFPTTRLVSPMYVVLMFYAGVAVARYRFE